MPSASQRCLRPPFHPEREGGGAEGADGGGTLPRPLGLPCQPTRKDAERGFACDLGSCKLTERTVWSSFQELQKSSVVRKLQKFTVNVRSFCYLALV